MLNIPEKFEEEIAASLPEGKKILLFGIGGGFDVLSCLPLYHTLRMKGYSLELANYSLVDFTLFPALAEPFIMTDHIYGANAHVKAGTEHFPEGLLSVWFKEGFGEEVKVWMLRQQTTVQLIKSFTTMIERLDIGLIILCGAGMRSIMMGNEEGCGEMLYPSIVLGAIRQIPVRSFIFTLGVNTHGGKRSESLYSAMENIQALIQDNAYFGGCVLEKSMDCFQYYKSAYEYIVDQPMHNQSPVHEITITAILGGFGQHRDGGFVCHTMSEGHFFDAITVSQYNLLIPHIETIPEYEDVVQIGLRIIHNQVNKRPRVAIQA